MSNLSIGLLILAGFLVIQSFVILGLLRKAVNRLAEVNKQLLIVVAGQNQKPGALRALAAACKPPQGKLKGIADEKKKDKKPENTNYIMEVGVH